MTAGPSARADSGLSPAQQELLQRLLARRSAARAPLEPVLSPAQERLWLIERTEPDRAAYNTVRAVRLSGRVDVAALRFALARLLERHQVLRTLVVEVDGAPAPRLADRPELPFTTGRASGLDAALARVRELAARPFRLDREIPLRAVLLHLDGSNSDAGAAGDAADDGNAAPEHVFAVVLHHIASDEGSRDVLWRELADGYRVAQGAPDPDGDVTQYAAFARAQRAALAARHEAEIDYWSTRLAGAPQQLTLPPDRRRPAAATFAGRRRRTRLDVAQLAAVRKLAADARTTPFVVSLAAWLWVVRQWSGETDVVVGLPVSARNGVVDGVLDGGFDDTIGLFVNTVTLRVDCGGPLTARELVQRTRATVVDALAHQLLPFEQVVDAVAGDRDPGRNPLFSLLVNGTRVREDALGQLPGLTATALDVDPGTAKFDVGTLFVERDGGLEVVVEYRTDLYDEATVELLLEQYAAVLARLTAAPGAPLGPEHLLTDRQRAALAAVNDTATTPVRRTVVAELGAQARRTPDAPAVADDTTGWLSYRELDERTNALAHRLRERGVGPGAVVAVCLPRSARMELAVLAVLKAGAAYLPLDGSYPAERLRYMLTDSGAPVLITDSEAQGHLPDHGDVLLLDELPAERRPDPPPGPALTDAAYVIYTSGSTGRPKGVVVEHAGLANRLRWMQDEFALTAADTVLQKTPLSFDVSVWEVLWPLLTGARLFLAAPGGHRDPGYLVTTVREQRVSVLHFVPSMLTAFLDAVDPDDPPPALRLVVASGEALPEALRDRCLRRLPAELANLYGPTEASIDVTAVRQRGRAGSELVTIGRPIANMTTDVLDDDGRPVAIGVPGELHLGGVGLARGYLHRPELTAERFVERPAVRPGRLYRTGDIVRWTPALELQYLGRRDGQVKLRGNRIELGEVQAALAAHPEVSAAAAILSGAGGGDAALLGYVVPDPAAPAPPAAGVDTAAVSDWAQVWERTYAADGGTDGGDGAADPELDVRGWISSYTGRPVPEAAMREWVAETVGRLRESAPRRVLEIGCGTGLLLWRLALHVEHYTAVDVSAATVARVRRQARERGLDHVEAHVAAAHQALELITDPVDLVVINSVAQYFPSLDYLDDVIGHALSVLRRPGRVFVGDVRNLDLLDAFDADVCAARASGHPTPAHLRQTVAARAAQESELLVSPAWFARLVERDGVTAVETRVKYGRADTEMNRFRYDVAITAGGPAPVAADPQPWPGDADATLAALAASGAEVAAFTGLVDARPQRGRAVRRWLATDGAVPLRRVRAAAPDGIEPGELAERAAAHGYVASLRPAPGGDGRLDAVLTRDGRPVALPLPDPPSPAANDPAAQAARREHRQWLADDLTRWVAERLPEPMRPAAIMVLDELPVGLSGKLDAAALPRPDADATADAGGAPATALEQQVATAWSRVLGRESVGVEANFFAIGGNSLAAARVAAHLERALGRRVPLTLVFEAQTVRSLAAALDRGVEDRAEVSGLRGPLVPLSPAQERMLFLDQLSDTTTLYGIRRVHRLRGPLDTQALSDAVGTIVARHEALRTTVTADRTHQEVHEERSVPVGVVDLSTAPDPESAVRAALASEADREFDLHRGPLVRVTCFRLAPEDHVLLLHCHHAVADGWSLNVVMSELAATLTGAALAPPAQYREFVAWQRDLLAGPVVAEQLAYWRGQLAGAPELLDLPTDRPRPPVRGHAGGRVTGALGPELTAAIGALARRRASTPFTVLLTGLSVLLGRLAGQRDVVVGTPVAGRTRAEFERAVGLFANTVALRARFELDEPAEHLVDRLSGTVLDAQRHQDVPFERVVSELDLARDASRTPVFQVLLNLVPPDADGGRRLGAATVEPFDVGTQRARFDLSWTLTERADGLAVALEFSRELFDEATAHALLARFTGLLTDLTARPDAAVGELALLLPGEAQLLRDWGHGPVREWPAATAPELVAAAARRHPDRVAVRDDHRALTYTELQRRADELAGALHAAGVRPGDRVGVAVPRGADVPVALLACWRAGAAYVPLDLDFPPERLRFMLADAGIEVAVGTAAAGTVLGGGVRLVAPDACGPLLPARSAATGVDTAYLIYTSGSTGRPKGVVVPHGALANLLQTLAERPGFTAGETWLSITTYSFDMAVPELMLPLAVGGTVHVVAPADTRDPYRLAELISTSGADVLQATPSTWRLLLDSGWPGDPGLRGWCGAEPLPPELARALAPRLARLWNLYGPTETTVWSTVAAVSGPPVTVGRPLANTLASVRDERLALVPPGVIGELCLGGAGVTDGYHGRPELTAAAFVRVEAAGGERTYRTGDLARWRADGQLEVLGRRDHQVKVRGHRIELGEIEHHLETHPAVSASVAVVDAAAQRVLAYVAAGTAAAASPDQLVAQLRALLRDAVPDYMVPAAIVVLPELPRSPNGKLDRAALPDPEFRPAAAAVPPATPTEKQLAAIWAEVLGIEEPSVDADFFGLGGHSLLAARMVARAGEQFGRRVPLRALFAEPTIRGLAAAVDADPAATTDTVPALARPAGPQPATPAQQRMWMLHALYPDSAAYHVPLLRRLDGPVDPDRLRAALAALVRWHPALRTTFTADDHGVQQAVHPSGALPLVVRDASATELDGVHRELRAEHRRPFDLGSGPVARALLLRSGADQSHLLVTAHHVAVDALSLRVLLDDLALAYEDPDRAAPTAPVAAAPQWSEADEQWWLDTLAGAAPAIELPTDRPHPARAGSDGGRVTLRLEPELSARIDALARAAGGTGFHVVTAALATLLHRHGAGDDIVIGTPTTGRDFPGAHRVVGPLINTVPLRLDLSGAPTFTELLARAGRVVRDAMAHDNVPFERLVDRLGSGHERGRHPICQVLVRGRPNLTAAPALGEATVSPVSIDWQQVQFDLACIVDTEPPAGVADRDAGRWVGLEYRSDVFDEATVRRLLERLILLLDTVTAAPERPLPDVDIATAEDRAVIEAAGPGRPVPAPAALLPDLLRRVAAAHPDRPAVRGGADELSYGQLVRAAEALGARLRARGIGPGDVVAVAVGRRVEWLVALLGAWAAGAAYVPIDGAEPAARLARMLATTGSRIVLNHPDDPAPTGLEALPVVAADLLADPPPGAVPVIPARDDAAYAIFTSGTTGVPKAIVCEHAHVAAFVDGLLTTVRGHTAIATAPVVRSLNSTLTFDAAVQQLAFLAAGDTLDVVPADVRRDPAALVDYLAARGVQTFEGTPTHFRLLLAAGYFDAPGHPPQLLLGGEAIDAGLWAEIARHTTGGHNCYGPTEVTCDALLARITDTDVPTLGRPLPGVRAYVVDERGRLLPPGVPGELWLGGPQVSRGYLGRPELTAERFAADPWSPQPGARLYRTGDRVRLGLDGTVAYLGRGDDQVKIRGHRIELGEVEAAFARRPGVRAAGAVVVPRPDGDELAVFVVPSVPSDPADDPATLDPAALRADVRDDLPAAMRPHWVRVVAELPTNRSGKLDRGALLAGLDPTGADDAHPTAAGGELDDPSEQLVAELWQELLGTPVRRSEDNFFDLGGNSLLAIRVVNRLRELGLELPIMAMFDEPTVGRVGSLVGEQLLAAALAHEAGA